jgi:hypothetical protein
MCGEVFSLIKMTAAINCANNPATLTRTSEIGEVRWVYTRKNGDINNSQGNGKSSNAEDGSARRKMGDHVVEIVKPENR